jgi:cysteinyl-tRNA synthetase
MAYPLFLSDSLTKSKKIFFDPNTLSDDPLNIYVCGITPYDHAHIGHARCYVSYDLLVRFVRFYNRKITYIQNITDVNEKIFEKAASQLGSEKFFKIIAQKYFLEYKSLLESLGCLNADLYPRVSDSIEEIIDFISNIISAGYAYETDDGVYFKASQFSSYGALSQRKIDSKSQLVTRLENKFEKEHSYDFVLWKKNPTAEISWESPWGKGLPGWHIECSTMIRSAFNGQSLDVHGGGLDLLFPHHENERAQSECLDCQKPLTKIWMHVAFMQINNEKMSKSLNNSILLKDILKEYDPMVLRFYFLMHHYKSPMQFDYQSLSNTTKSYHSFIDIFEKESPILPEQLGPSITMNSAIIDEINKFLSDDLNTSAAIGLIFKHKEEISANFALKKEIKEMVLYILGLNLIKKEKENNHNYSEEIESLISAREEARAQKNFVKADEIKKILIEKGISITDKKLTK